MPRITYTVEKIIDKFRETEVVLAKGQTVVCTASLNLGDYPHLDR